VQSNTRLPFNTRSIRAPCRRLITLWWGRPVWQFQIWCAIVALACELTTWMQLLAFTDADGNNHEARRWEPQTPAPAAVLDRRAARPNRTPHRRAPRPQRRRTTVLHAGLTHLRALIAPG
jgi:hypothetical protein